MYIHMDEKYFLESIKSRFTARVQYGTRLVFVIVLYILMFIFLQGDFFFNEIYLRIVRVFPRSNRRWLLTVVFSFVLRLTLCEYNTRLQKLTVKYEWLIEPVFSRRERIRIYNINFIYLRNYSSLNYFTIIIKQISDKSWKCCFTLLRYFGMPNLKTKICRRRKSE